MKKVNVKVYGAALDALQEQFSAEAAEYANRILDAAMAAENFVYNGYAVDYGGGEQ